LKTEN